MSSIAVLFPGQGSQQKGMGRDLAETRSEAMELWTLAEKESGLDLRGVFWDGEEKDMADTRALQPGLTVVNLSLWLAASKKLSPVAAAGHSLGEFAALVAAGVLSVEDALRAVTLRGRLMSEAGAEGQGMAAVLKLDRDAVEEVVAEARDEADAELRIANYNTPKQFVISGERAALDAAAPRIKERKGRAVPLAVSGAFHSPLIREAADEFSGVLEKLHWREPDFDVYFNVTGKPGRNAAEIRGLMQTQMTSSVMWIDTMVNMHDAGVRRFAELGPKGVLAKMAGATLKGREFEAFGVESVRGVDDL